MRLYGPNCPGLCNVNQRLGFTFSPSFPHDLQKGPIGLATQPIAAGFYVHTHNVKSGYLPTYTLPAA